MASRNNLKKKTKKTTVVKKSSNKPSKLASAKAKPSSSSKPKAVKKPKAAVSKSANSSKSVKKAKPSEKTPVKSAEKTNTKVEKIQSAPNEQVKRKRGRPPKNPALVAEASAASTEPVVKRGRGRPRKNPLPTPEELAAGPKKRGRKPKNANQLVDPNSVAYQPGQLLNPDIPIKRKRGRPRKSEQLGYGMSGPGRYSFIPRPNVQVKRYIWSAETGQSLSPDGLSAEAKDAGASVKESDQVVEFREKDKVVYPAHGLGIVEAVQVRSVSGSQQKFYMISIVETGMKIMVPVSQAKTVGLRRVVDPSTVDKVYAILKDKDVEIDNQTWNRRYREYSQKIKTGSVLEIASVIRDLTVLKIDKELSFNERRMLDTAQGLLVKELSIAKSSPEDSIREELEEICQP